MIARNGPLVEHRLRQCSLYDPTLDLAVEDERGTVAGYALFWFDPSTEVGLLEPMDDCSRGSSFHIEPSGPRAQGRYVFRVDGQGCVGIRDGSGAAGVEAVMGPCTARSTQLFTIESVS